MSYDPRKLDPTLPPVPLFATAYQKGQQAERALGGKQNMTGVVKALAAPVGLEPTVQYLADGGTLDEPSFDTDPSWYAQQAASVLDTALAPTLDSWESPAIANAGLSSVDARPFVNPAGAAPAPGVQAAPAFEASANVVPPAYQNLTRTTPQYAESIVPPDTRSSLEKARDLLLNARPGLVGATGTGLTMRQGASANDLATAYNTNIPVYSDFARSTIQPALGTLGEFAGAGVDMQAGGLSQLLNSKLGTPTTAQAGRFAGEAFAPVTLGDVALGAATGNVTGVDDLLIAGGKKALTGYADNALRAGVGAVPEGAVRRTVAEAAPLRSIPVPPTAAELSARLRAGPSAAGSLDEVINPRAESLYRGIGPDMLNETLATGDMPSTMGATWWNGRRPDYTYVSGAYREPGLIAEMPTPAGVAVPPEAMGRAYVPLQTGDVSLQDASRIFGVEFGNEGGVRAQDVTGMFKSGSNIPRGISPTEGEGIMRTAGAGSRKPKVSPSVAGSEASPAGLTDAATAPPAGSPPSGTATGGELDPVKKLTTIIDQARPLPAQTEAVRSAERAQRVAASASILERGGRTPDAYQAARGALGGEYSRAAFDAPSTNFAPEEVAALRNQLSDAGLRHFEEINAEQALSKVLDGRLNEVRNFELDLLDRVYGSDLSLAIAAKAMPASFGDKAFEFWISNILSGPITHMRNFVGNSAAALSSPIERLGAAALEQPVSLIQGRAAERFFAEVPAEVFGMARGVPEGTRAALRTIKNGWGQSALTESARAPAIGGKLGRVIRTPLTALEAMDGFFRAINFEGAKSALAVREAKMAGLKGDALTTRIAELMANPSDDLLEKATQSSLYRLFRDEPTRYGQAVMAARDKAPALRFIIPFARTPDRLIAYGVKRSPLGLLDAGMWKRLAAKNPAAVDELAQTLIGSTVAMGLGTMVANSTIEITGATPDDRAARDRFYREGKLPFSVNLPGIGWVQYSQIPGLDTTLSTVAAAQEAYKSGGKVDDFAAQLGATVAQNLWDKSYVSGLADFMDIFGHGYTDPVDSAKRWAARNVSGFVPGSAALRQTGQMFDQTIRDPKTITEQVATGVGIPNAIAPVPPRLTAFGEESKRAFPSPISAQGDKQTAVDAELARLGEEVTFVGKLINGSREEQFAYQQMAGQMHKFLLERAIADPRYESLPDAGKVAVIESLVSNAREPVRDVIYALTASEGYQAASDADKQEMLRRAAEKWLAKIEERR